MKISNFPKRLPSMSRLCYRNFHLFIFLSLICSYSFSADFCTFDGVRQSFIYAVEKQSSVVLQRRSRYQKTLSLEGKTKSSSDYLASKLALEDFRVVRFAAAYWLYSKDSKYIDPINQYVMDWVNNYESKFNPINDSELYFLAQSVMIADPILTPNVRNKAHVFFGNLLKGYLFRSKYRFDEFYPPSSSVWSNNWQANRINLMINFALAIKDYDSLLEIIPVFQSFLDDSVYSDGALRDFSDRGSLNYVVYSLNLIAEAELVMRRFAKSILSADSDGKYWQAVQFLDDYVQGRKVNYEYSTSKVHFDLIRAKEGMIKIGESWDPKRSAVLFWNLSQFNISYKDTAEKMSAEPLFVGFCRL